MFSARNRGPRSFQAVAVAIAACSLLLASTGTGSAQEATSDIEISIAVHPSTVPPVPATSPATPGLPGTVSSQIVWLNQPHGDIDGPAIAFIVVRDDRGIASGWEIALSSVGGTGALPDLLVNKDGSIMRVLPGDGRLSDQVQGITGGRTLGPFVDPIPVLHAVSGSGSGLFLQELHLLVPGSELTTIDGTLCVQLPFAP